MSDKCLNCDKDISNGDTFMKIEIDMRRLIYKENEDERNFLIPNGPIRLAEKLYLCQICSRGLMRMTPKDIVKSIIEKRNMKNHDE